MFSFSSIFPVGVQRASPPLTDSLLPTQHWVELNPCHISLGNVGHVAPGTLGDRPFRIRRRVRFRVMTECEKAPPVTFGEALTVFHGYVDAVVFAVEIASSGRLGTRAIRESWITDACQLLHDDCTFRE